MGRAGDIVAVLHQFGTALRGFEHVEVRAAAWACRARL